MQGSLTKLSSKEKHIMENQDHMTAVTSQSTPSKAELEQHLRARAWKDDAFRQEFLTNPKAVLERDYAQYFCEGKIPSELSIKVIEEEEQAICFVLPSRSPDDQISDLENIDDEDISTVAGGTYGTKVRGTQCITCVSCMGCTGRCTRGQCPSGSCAVCSRPKIRL
jgi:hypothetical protein